MEKEHCSSDLFLVVLLQLEQIIIGDHLPNESRDIYNAASAKKK